jgi:hypothetical protein
VDEVAVKQRLDSVNQRVGSGPFEPDVPAQVVLSRSNRYKAAAGLKYDSGLLRIDVHLAEAANGLRQCLKEFPNLRILILEVFNNGMATARMRHVARDKPLFTLGAHPQRSFLLVDYSIAHSFLRR